MPVYKRNIKFRFRQVGEKMFLLERNKAIQINETSKRIWELMDQKNNVDSIIKIIANEYHISADEIRDDILECINILKNNEALTEIKTEEKKDM